MYKFPLEMIDEIVDYKHQLKPAYKQFQHNLCHRFLCSIMDFSIKEKSSTTSIYAKHFVTIDRRNYAILH